MSRSAVARHAADHVTQAIKESQAASDEARALDVVREMEWCNQQAHSIYEKASGDEDSQMPPDLRLALSAVGEVRKQAELWAEIQGELDRGTHVNIGQSPEWLNMREIIFQALAPFPEARVAVARALHEEAERGRRIS